MYCVCLPTAAVVELVAERDPFLLDEVDDPAQRAVVRVQQHLPALDVVADRSKRKGPAGAVGALPQLLADGGRERKRAAPQVLRVLREYLGERAELRGPVPPVAAHRQR